MKPEQRKIHVLRKHLKEAVCLIVDLFAKAFLPIRLLSFLSLSVILRYPCLTLVGAIWRIHLHRVLSSKVSVEA